MPYAAFGRDAVVCEECEEEISLVDTYWSGRHYIWDCPRCGHTNVLLPED